MRRAILWVAGVVAAVFVALALFERFVPRRVLRWYQKHVGSRVFGAGAGIVPGWVLLETTGRRTRGQHRVPVGGRLIGDTYWLLAGTGRDAHYVRNIEHDPRVRVRVHGRWREGIATIRPDEDPRPMLLRLNPVNGVFLWLTGHELLPVRIDLEPLHVAATPDLLHPAADPFCE